MTEIWKTYRSGVYEVSDQGRVRKNGKIVRGSINQAGYHVVTLTLPGEKKRAEYVHRMVLEVFVGPSDLCGLHRDDIGTNNVLTNLYYGTKADNAQDRIRNNRVPRGEKTSWSKLTEDQARDILERHARGESQASMARHFGVHVMTVNDVVHRRTWNHL